VGSFPSVQQRLEPLINERSEGVTRLVDQIIALALQARASDVHLQPEKKSLKIRFRLDGVLTDVAEVPRELSENVIGRLKVLARLLSYRTDLPQEGRATFDSGGQTTDLRISTFPTIHGERAVIKNFGPTEMPLAIDQVGFRTQQLASLKRAIVQPDGMVIFTGPAGSGKTTSIYACLRYILEYTAHGKNVVSIEDPVERDVEGLSQTQINPYTGFTFQVALRSILRQDPEVIAIGEIRDRDTARIATEAALTGHLVITTLHCGSAVGVFARLLEMGIEPFLLTSSVRLVANQRLLRALCTTCHKDNSSGCPQCLGTGYSGRVMIAELVEASQALKAAILARKSIDDLKSAVDGSGFLDLSQAAAQLVSDSVTDQAEVTRVLLGGDAPPGSP